MLLILLILLHLLLAMLLLLFYNYSANYKQENTGIADNCPGNRVATGDNRTCVYANSGCLAIANEVQIATNQCPMVLKAKREEATIKGTLDVCLYSHQGIPINSMPSPTNTGNLQEQMFVEFDHTHVLYCQH
ncbi:hypothetical protein BGX38DRAFT_1145978 [Terfezia claveryi]|nr:hypothetical protein BGX38DRAFT_1145978 [Terfezia claveryi]